MLAEQLALEIELSKLGALTLFGQPNAPMIAVKLDDLWRQQDVGTVNAITVRVGPHGAEIFKVESIQPSTAPSAK